MAIPGRSCTLSEPPKGASHFLARGFSPGRPDMTSHRRLRTVGAHGRAPCETAGQLIGPPTKNSFPARGENAGTPPRCGPVRRRDTTEFCALISPGRSGMATYRRSRTIGAHGSAPGRLHGPRYGRVLSAIFNGKKSGFDSRRELFCVGGGRAKPAHHPHKTLSMHGARTPAPYRGADPSAAKVLINSVRPRRAVVQVESYRTGDVPCRTK